MSARLTDAEALTLYSELSIHELGRRAFARCAELHPEPYRTYVVDRNVNYANVCTARCIFCNFYRKPGSDEAYILSYEQIGQKIEELLDIGGTQILMQGGLVPGEHDPSGHGLPLTWYLDLLRFIKKNYQTIHIHAFSPPEIWAFHQVFGLPLHDLLLRLQDAGLDTIPGGGGEILVDRVRRKIGQGKTLTDEWLAVMRAAHGIGMKTSCTMMFGHIETVPERIEHLHRLRELQDETGGFTAFIHWPFQPEGTPLGRWKAPPDGYDGPPDGEHLFLADAHEYLKMLALARLYLDNVPNIQLNAWLLDKCIAYAKAHRHPELTERASAGGARLRHGDAFGLVLLRQCDRAGGVRLDAAVGRPDRHGAAGGRDPDRRRPRVCA